MSSLKTMRQHATLTHDNHEVFTAHIERIALNGAGILTHNGRKFFVDNTAPHDVVTVRAQETRESWGKAELLGIEEPSPFRVRCVCPLDRCGGCSLQHLAYETQIAEKAAILKEQFIRIGHGMDAPEIRIRRSEPFGYRNRVQFHRFKASLPGFKVKQSDEIVPVAACPVADEGINRALAEKRITPPVEKDRWTVYAYKDTFLMEGKNSRGAVDILGTRLFLDAGVFFQSNAAALEPLIADVVSAAEEAGSGDLPAADIYCGVGTFAAFLHGLNRFKRIDAVEVNKAALSRARDTINAMRPHDARPRTRTDFFAVSADTWAKNNRNRYGFIIADPPREGLSPGVRAWLCQQDAAVFAYVSCNPAALARDSAALIQSGYALSSLTFYDFYPHTPHIESVALFKMVKRE
ncbi:MAG: class I SAM-dependent RNA methyltransferase [Treponema sp.]|jgi:23S rRNA (uracil1939-C5)-methyltransferase|nr:class I SAM-dependent RNA methyltransferase [Treponema sp.]